MIRANENINYCKLLGQTQKPTGGRQTLIIDYDALSFKSDLNFGVLSFFFFFNNIHANSPK